MSWPTPRSLPHEPPITPDALVRHNLSDDEYGRILQILGRVPTWTELGVFSVMWSEHCSYKSSRIHLRNLPTEAPHVLQGPGENAGIIDIGNGLAVAFKMESHNHPSFIEPYQGAATGVGGILRDVFTMGARPVALLDLLRFGRPEGPKMRRLVTGVVAGIAGYGNCVGVPTVGGDVGFHPCYDGNILVNAMAVGLLASDRIFRGIAAGPGNPVLYVGSRTGRDGIHGATMASDTFLDGTEAPRPTVQVGDPYAEKLLIEAVLELLREDAVVAIQDMGAAGLTSSSVEMAGRGGTGLLLHIDRVPRREPGMSPYECLLSESQERMLVIAKKGREDVVARIFAKWDLECAEIGVVTDDGLWRILDGDVVVAAIPTGALTDDAPKYDRPSAPPADLAERQCLPELAASPDPGATLLRLIADPDVADKRWVYRQYDHMVQLGTVLRPGAADAAVIRVDGNRCLAIKVDCNSVHVRLDPWTGTAGTVAECARNVACTGATPLALTDCLNFGSPKRPEVMWELKESIGGLAEACRELGIPVVSGNVSLYNETGSQGIHPTPAVGVVGLMEDGRLALGFAFPAPGLLVFSVGTARPTFGGSLWARRVHGIEAGMPPAPRWPEERALHAFLARAASAGLLRSAHDLSDGGFAVAVAECCVAGRVGARLELPVPPDPASRELSLFGETHGAAIVSAEPARAADLIALAMELGCMARGLGETGGDDLVLTDAGGVSFLCLPVAALAAAHGRGFTEALGFEPVPGGR